VREVKGVHARPAEAIANNQCCSEFLNIRPTEAGTDNQYCSGFVNTHPAESKRVFHSETDFVSERTNEILPKHTLEPHCKTIRYLYANTMKTKILLVLYCLFLSQFIRSQTIIIGYSDLFTIGDKTYVSPRPTTSFPRWMKGLLLPGQKCVQLVFGAIG
jgi:hypothetical protein